MSEHKQPGKHTKRTSWVDDDSSTSSNVSNNSHVHDAPDDSSDSSATSAANKTAPCGKFKFLKDIRNYLWPTYKSASHRIISVVSDSLSAQSLASLAGAVTSDEELSVFRTAFDEWKVSINSYILTLVPVSYRVQPDQKNKSVSDFFYNTTTKIIQDSQHRDLTRFFHRTKSKIIVNSTYSYLSSKFSYYCPSKFASYVLNLVQEPQSFFNCNQNPDLDNALHFNRNSDKYYSLRESLNIITDCYIYLWVHLQYTIGIIICLSQDLLSSSSSYYLTVQQDNLSCKSNIFTYKLVLALNTHYFTTCETICTAPDPDHGRCATTGFSTPSASAPATSGFSAGTSAVTRRSKLNSGLSNMSTTTGPTVAARTQNFVVLAISAQLTPSGHMSGFSKFPLRESTPSASVPATTGSSASTSAVIRRTKSKEKEPATPAHSK